MKKTRLLALLLALCMVVALFAACGGTEPEETSDTTADTSDTTVGDTSADDTTAADTSDTEPAVDLDGYAFTMGNGGLKDYMTGGENASTERGAKLQDGVAAIEEKLNCTIEFTDGGSADEMEKIATAATALFRQLMLSSGISIPVNAHQLPGNKDGEYASCTANQGNAQCLNAYDSQIGNNLRVGPHPESHYQADYIDSDHHCPGTEIKALFPLSQVKRNQVTYYHNAPVEQQ